MQIERPYDGSVTLTLSEDEADFIRKLLSCVGGSYWGKGRQARYRIMADDFIAEFDNVGIPFQDPGVVEGSQITFLD
jgi:hypothetical protein